MYVHIKQSSDTLLYQGSRLRPLFESVRVKIWRGRTCASAWSALLQSICFIQRAAEPWHIVAGVRFHWSSEERRFQHERFSRAWFILGASARARRCAQRTERNRGFGFQTKMKDRFLNQRRWTCWYSCRENMQVLSATDSLVLFCFRFEKLVIFAVYLKLHYGGFPYFFYIIIIWFLSVC